MRDFAVHFREHVIPRLRNLCKAEALCIVRGVETWEGAHDAIYRYAANRGAFQLGSYALMQLDDWICTTLLTAIDEHERTAMADAA